VLALAAGVGAGAFGDVGFAGGMHFWFILWVSVALPSLGRLYCLLLYRAIAGFWE
jgi:hypothetical protein